MAGLRARQHLGVPIRIVELASHPAKPQKLQTWLHAAWLRPNLLQKTNL